MKTNIRHLVVGCHLAYFLNIPPAFPGAPFMHSEASSFIFWGLPILVIK